MESLIRCVQLDAQWIIDIDNQFATNTLGAIRNNNLEGLPEVRSGARLCGVCSGLDLSRTGFTVQLDLDRLQQTAPTCDLCQIICKVSRGKEGAQPIRTTLMRVGSWLYVGSNRCFLISRTRTTKAFHDIQIGLPVLPIAGSSAHFEVIRQWLHECDIKHNHDRDAPAGDSRPDLTLLPTRLLDIGDFEQSDTIRLWETKPGDVEQYIALSHPWGAQPHFRTITSNLAAHMAGISIADLPATYRHAVVTARALGVRHLWIDSICIIQGPDGDFTSEAKRMELVFRGAYCVLAASCARGQSSGFLGPRKEADYVPLLSTNEDGPFYVRENVDDFEHHALGGYLNSRGWVLQEHALARRTIFFTEHQTYWECGRGVRCETGVKMSSPRAAFLGDTHFPQMVMSASTGEQIVRYQNLYAQYSRLGLTRSTDRLYAIDGLQTRLLRAFGSTKGEFGLLDEGPRLLGHLRRSLLWIRGEDVDRLDPIDFEGINTPPPSWSWMAYTGGISYLSPAFNRTNWKVLSSPWTRDDWKNTPTKPLKNNRVLTLQGRAVKFDLTDVQNEGSLIFDRPEEDATCPLLQCVVLGVSDGKHYVLVVKPKDEEDGKTALWTRVGAGFLPERCLQGEQTEIVIC